MRYCLIIGLATVWAVIDQVTKWIVNTSLALYESIPVTSFFTLVHVRNRGAAFGFLNDPDISWQFWVFLASTLFAIVIILILAKGAHRKDTLLFIAFGSIMGGAIGNLIDRIRFRAVVDFLDVHYAGWHWPAFNVADIAICFGAGLTALLILKQPGKKDTNNTAESASSQKSKRSNS